ncbi:hypothetical protein PhCBS80983_g01368 [Powellomyces hirtus]|uniref:UDENN domain-containing protein n=1 Tax=Powellomyces hirtus TaxID=109895 RepID=A0A507ED45_9FUNG|nr:hypothetical protein PhCBS80983_g01368 [Powellomyces hirtus]
MPSTASHPPPPRPANMQRRRTIVRTDSAPCDLSDDGAVSEMQASFMNARGGGGSRTPPQSMSHRPSLIDSRMLFGGDRDVRRKGSEELVASPIDQGFPRRKEGPETDDEQASSRYSTASEGDDASKPDVAPSKSVAEKPAITAVSQPPPPSLPAVTTKLPMGPYSALPSPQHSLLMMRSPLSPAGGGNLLDHSLLSLNLRMFWQWILCVCLVNFDLELGQALECVYPPIEFSEAEKKNISFSAFPDSNSTAHVGDSTFTFRMRSGHFTTELYRRQQPPPLQTATPTSGATPTTPNKPNGRGIETLHPGAGLPVDTDGHTYGYVFFRQQKDPQIRRGYFQKSLVILSPHPWPGLFLKLVGLLGPKYMDALCQDRRIVAASSDLSSSSPASAAKALLETACFNIAAWPPPPSTLSSETAYIPIPLTLPFLGVASQYSFPPNARFAQLFEAPTRTLSQYHQDDPTICTPGRFYQLFNGSLELMWIAWELLVIGQSLLVVAESPQACSDIIWGLVELLKPIPFGGDFRPYFTIQDSDFKGIASRQRLPTTATILGVTNPVFTKVLEHWPNVVRAAKAVSVSSQSGSQESPLANGAGGGHHHHVTPPRPYTSSNPPPLLANFSPPPPKSSGILSPFSKSSKQASTSSATSSPATKSHRPSGATPADGVRIESLTCKHKPFLSKDRGLIKEVVEAAIRGKPTHVLNNMLRRHFMDLTERFIQPLNKHFQSLVMGNPQTMTLSNIRARPEIRPFKQESFLDIVDTLTAGTQSFLPVHTKRPLRDLYRAFLLSPNFAAWLQHRTEEVFRDWRRKYIAVLCTSDVENWAKDKLANAVSIAKPKTALASAPAAAATVVSPLRRASSSAMGDIECVDLILRIRDEVVKYAPYFASPESSFSSCEATGGNYSMTNSRTTSPAHAFSPLVPAAVSPSPQAPRDPQQQAFSPTTPAITTTINSTTSRPTYIDLSTGTPHAAWASTICAAAPSPHSPGPVSVMGGVVPTKQQYEQLNTQLERLVAVLPDDLRASVVTGCTKNRGKGKGR